MCHHFSLIWPNIRDHLSEWQADAQRHTPKMSTLTIRSYIHKHTCTHMYMHIHDTRIPPRVWKAGDCPLGAQINAFTDSSWTQITDWIDWRDWNDKKDGYFIVWIDYLSPGGIRESIYLSSRGVVACLPYSGWYPCVVYVHVHVCVCVRACRKGGYFGCVCVCVVRGPLVIHSSDFVSSARLKKNDDTYTGFLLKIGII